MTLKVFDPSKDEMVDVDQAWIDLASKTISLMAMRSGIIRILSTLNLQNPESEKYIKALAKIQPPEVKRT